MENENEINQSFFEKILLKIKTKKKVIISAIIIVFIIFVSFFSFKQIQIIKNKEISEKYIIAGIHLSNKEFEESKKIYEEIIDSKNKFYSFLALNGILENDLEKDDKKVLDLFKKVEGIRKGTNQTDLLMLKKALFLMKISKEEEAKIILEDIIQKNSLWKETAQELLN